MLDNYTHIVTVQLHEDSYGKYNFALFDAEEPYVSIGDLVIVNAGGVKQRKVGKVINKIPVEEYTGSKVTAEVVGTVTIKGYYARYEEEKRQNDIKKKISVIEKKLDSKLSQIKSREFYKKMAAEYSEFDSTLKDLVDELEKLEDMRHDIES